MLCQFRKWLHKKIYKALIYKTIVLDKSSVVHYDKLDPFCEFNVETDKGVFKFIFKKDRRKTNRPDTNPPTISSYIIELKVPEHLIPTDDTVNSKIVIVVKVMLFKPDYEVLTELLTDAYMDTILKYISNRV
jgi:hypothetical protein